MKWMCLILITNLFFSASAFSELSGGDYEFQSANGRSVQLNEKEYRCLQARKSLESIFSESSDHFNQPFEEVRDAVQAYKKLDCVYTAGFLFTHPRQVDRYFKYKARGASRAPASLD